MPEYSVALLFLCLLHSAVGLLGYGASDPVYLHLIASDYVKLRVGNPGKLYTFRINLTLSDIHFHRRIETESRTVTSHPDGSGSELIYIGHSVYRLPFHYASFDASDRVAEMTTATQNVATLGLGRNSPLWRHWRSYSLTRDRLVLGELDRFARLSSEDWPALISISSPPEFLINDQYPYPVSLHFHRFDTELPHELTLQTSKITRLAYNGSEDCQTQYERLGWDLSQCAQTQTLQFYDQSITLTDNIVYSGIQHSHDGSIHFGRRFLEDYVLFVDLDSDQLFLASSIYSWGESDFNALAATALFVIWALWSTRVLNGTETPTETRFLSIVAMETLAYLIALIALFVALVGFRWDRLLGILLEREPWVILGLLLAQNLAFSGVGLWLLLSRFKFPLHKELTERRQQYNWALLEHSLLPRLLLLSTVALSTLWLLVLPEHMDSRDIVLSTVCSTAMTLVTLVVSLHLAIKDIDKTWMLVLLNAAHHLFLVFATLLPIHRLFIGPLMDSVMFCTVYILLLCWFPAVIIWAKVQITISVYQSAKAYSEQTAGTGAEPAQVNIADAFSYWLVTEGEVMDSYLHM